MIMKMRSTLESEQNGLSKDKSLSSGIEKCHMEKFFKAQLKSKDKRETK